MSYEQDNQIKFIDFGVAINLKNVLVKSIFTTTSLQGMGIYEQIKMDYQIFIKLYDCHSGVS
jgi:hypothetical protein